MEKWETSALNFNYLWGSGCVQNPPISHKELGHQLSPEAASSSTSSLGKGVSEKKKTGDSGDLAMRSYLGPTFSTFHGFKNFESIICL